MCTIVSRSFISNVFSLIRMSSSLVTLDCNLLVKFLYYKCITINLRTRKK